MTFLILVFGISLLIFIFLYRQVTLYRVRVCNDLNNEQTKIQARFKATVERKRELVQELADKEIRLATLRNYGGRAPSVATGKLDLDEPDITERISRHLLSNGIITLEQNERALQKMEVLRMDFLGVCAALGFIDLKTSQETLAAIKETKPVRVSKSK